MHIVAIVDTKKPEEAAAYLAQVRLLLSDFAALSPCCDLVYLDSANSHLAVVDGTGDAPRVLGLHRQLELLRCRLPSHVRGPTRVETGDPASFARAPGSDVRALVVCASHPHAWRLIQHASIPVWVVPEADVQSAADLDLYKKTDHVIPFARAPRSRFP